MTRIKFLGALAVAAITVVGIAFLPRSQGKNTETVNSKVEALVLANYAVEIIVPKHPAFSKLMAKNKPDKETPFSVFVDNKNDRAIASCSLKWEILQSNGQIATHFQTKTGTLEVVSEGGVAHLSEGIPARGNLLFSLTHSSTPDDQTSTAFRTSGGSYDVVRQLSDCVKVTVSIDGVLFVDGTYVGPDTNNYFELFRGQIDANRVLENEIDRLVSDGATPERIKNHLRKISNTQSSEVKIPSGEDAQYSFGKWMQQKRYATLLLLMTEKKGHQTVLDHVRAELTKPQIKLRKLSEN